ncbi:dicer-like protein 4, partial [Haematococcus lacustris]
MEGSISIDPEAQPTARQVNSATLPAGSTVVFLAPTVPLCAQQADVLTEAGLRVALHSLLQGSLSKKLQKGAAGAQQWQALVSGHQVVVATPGELLHGLLHGLMRMEQVALLVLDEVHHADKDHPYAAIARQFVAPLAAGGRAPRLLGLTASPVQ